MQDALQALLSSRGFLGTPRLLSVECAEACRVEAIAMLKTALSSSNLEDMEAHLCDEATPFRYTVNLRLTPAVVAALLEIRCSALVPIIAHRLGADAAIIGLACTLTERGALPRPAHQMSESGEAISIEVALSSCDGDGSGATSVYARQASSLPCDDWGAPLRMDLKAGDGLLSTAQLWRCAGAHVGVRRYHATLLVTFARASALATSFAGPLRMSSELLGRLSLDTMAAALDSGAWAAPRLWEIDSEAEGWYLPPGSAFLPPGTEYLRRNAAGELAVFSDDGWLFGSFGDSGDLGGSVRMCPAGSRRGAVRRSLQRLHRLSERLDGIGEVGGRGPPTDRNGAAANGAAANGVAGRADGGMVGCASQAVTRIPRPLVEVMLGLLRQLPAEDVRVRKCTAILTSVLRMRAAARPPDGGGGDDDGGGDGGGGGDSVPVPLAAVRLLRAWRVAGEHVQAYLEHTLQMAEASRVSSGGGDDVHGDHLDASTIASRWADAHVRFGGAAPTISQAMASRASTPAKAFAAVHAAASCGDSAAVLKWVDDGSGSIDARAGPRLSTLLSAASEAGHAALIAALLDRNASLDISDDAGGATALHLAAAAGREAAVRQLLTSGATVDICDREGHTALAWAEACGHGAIATLLRGQLFEPVLLRSLLDARQVAQLLALRRRLVGSSPGLRTLMDGCDSHEVVFLHAASAQPDVERAGLTPLLAGLVDAMRRADPRPSVRQISPAGGASAANGNEHLTVRSCELHTYGPSGALMDRDHRDAGSSITMSVLLSDPAQLHGGRFLTWQPAAMTHELARGDGVLFRSEAYHNVSPVEEGTRQSLVIELWTGEANAVDRNS